MVDRVVDEAVEEVVNIPSPHLCMGGEGAEGLRPSLHREGDENRVQIARECEELDLWSFVGYFAFGHRSVGI